MVPGGGRTATDRPPILHNSRLTEAHFLTEHTVLPPRGLLGHERLLKTFLAAALMSGGAASVAAHPHVWATVRSEIVFGPDHRITGIRHHWTFDEFYTAMAVEGLDTNKDGVYSKEELAPLAKVNVESLKEFDYFTFVHLEARTTSSLKLKPPVDYSVDYDKSVLTLHFTLPLETPVDTQGQAGRGRRLRSVVFRRFRLRHREAGDVGGRRHQRLHRRGRHSPIPRPPPTPRR